MDVDVADVSVVGIERREPVVDEILDHVRHRDARRDQQQHHGEQYDDYLAFAGHEVHQRKRPREAASLCESVVALGGARRIHDCM